MNRLFLTNGPTRLARRAPKRGFSLVEILVALVVLLIGILSILRLFPAGFLTIQRTGEVVNGDSLVSQRLEQMKNALSVPEAIVPALLESDGTTSKILYLPDIRPDDYTNYQPGEITADSGFSFTPDDDYFKSDVNRIRFIKGETFRIPISGKSGGGPAGAVYMLQNGPVYNQFAGDDTTPTDSIKVYGAALTRSVQSSIDPSGNGDRPTPNLPDDSQYAIDYENLQIGFFPRLKDASQPAGSYQRKYYLTFDYYDDSTKSVKTYSDLGTPTISIPDVDPAKVPAGETPQPVWVDLKSFPALSAIINTGFHILPDTDTVNRAFRLISKQTYNVNSQPTFSNDPYEYAWFSRQYGGTTAPGNPGVLMFNPKGRVTILDTNAVDAGAVAFNNQSPLTARVDYFAFDNHIIRDDRVIPVQAPYQIKLTLPFLYTNGDVGNDLVPFTGMFRDGSDNPINTPDIMVYNPVTGEELCNLTKGVVSGLVNMTISAKTGTVTLSPLNNTQAAKDALTALQGQSVRIFYKAQRDWGMQMQKASAHYTLAQTLDQFLAPDGYNKYYIDPTENANKPTKVYFRACEAGKIVVLGDLHFAPLTGGNLPGSDRPDQFQTATGEAYKVEDNPANFKTFTGSDGVGHACPLIDVTSQHPNTALSTIPTGRYVDNVQGVSLKSRVIWRNGERWRRVENDSILSPSGRY